LSYATRHDEENRHEIALTASGPAFATEHAQLWRTHALVDVATVLSVNPAAAQPAAAAATATDPMFGALLSALTADAPATPSLDTPLPVTNLAAASLIQNSTASGDGLAAMIGTVGSVPPAFTFTAGGSLSADDTSDDTAGTAAKPENDPALALMAMLQLQPAFQTTTANVLPTAMTSSGTSDAAASDATDGDDTTDDAKADATLAANGSSMTPPTDPSTATAAAILAATPAAAPSGQTSGQASGLEPVQAAVAGVVENAAALATPRAAQGEAKTDSKSDAKADPKIKAAVKPLAAGQTDPALDTTAGKTADAAAAKQPDAVSPVEPDPTHRDAAAKPPTASEASPQTATAKTDTVTPQTASAAASIPVQAQAIAGSVAAEVQVSPHRHAAETVTSFDKLGVAIAAKSAEGLHEFDIRLDPPDLGRIQVKLTVDDAGQTQASLVVDKPQTLDLLQRDAAGLNRTLADAGLNLTGNGLSFSLREQQQQTGNAGPKGRSRSLSVNAVATGTANPSAASYAPNSVRLDIRV
jgi:flagellar hook-length control protein FliK